MVERRIEKILSLLLLRLLQLLHVQSGKSRHMYTPLVDRHDSIACVGPGRLRSPVGTGRGDPQRTSPNSRHGNNGSYLQRYSFHADKQSKDSLISSEIFFASNEVDSCPIRQIQAHRRHRHHHRRDKEKENHYMDDEIEQSLYHERNGNRFHTYTHLA
jgi:hypothetical protein